jgi:hypothetical protein
MTTWQPIETIPETRPILVRAKDGSAWSTTLLSPRRSWFEWAPYPDEPAPDPMTVAAWHPMDLLPDDHPEPVLIRYGADYSVMSDTQRRYDRIQNRLEWMPLAPLLALVEEQ